MYAIRSYYVLAEVDADIAREIEAKAATDVASRQPRITSYNVCYTKLLRQPQSKTIARNSEFVREGNPVREQYKRRLSRMQQGWL